MPLSLRLLPDKTNDIYTFSAQLNEQIIRERVVVALTTWEAHYFELH